MKEENIEQLLSELATRATEPARPAVPLQYTGEVERLINRYDGVVLPES